MGFDKVFTMIFFVGMVAASSSPVPKMSVAPPPTFQCTKGQIVLVSEAPLEVIKASSNKLKGALAPQKRTFVWMVDIASFEGFNNPLQREHFNENYLETHLYPTARFSGKIIEDTDLTQDGTYTVRAKGQLVVHGVPQERIIKTTITVRGSQMKAKAIFSVPLSEHDIVIPKLVYQKIAEEIIVYVDAELMAKP